jgi:hypothetical protein
MPAPGVRESTGGDPAVAAQGNSPRKNEAPLSGFRTAEKIVIAYFMYLAILAALRDLPLSRIALALLLPAAIAATIWTAILRPGKWSNLLRNWALLILILVGYWELQWFASDRLIPWQQTWLNWDRQVLGAWGLRAAIEAFGPVIPALLEVSYLCVYAIPPFCLAALYILGRRDRINSFLTTLFMGSFCAYALLPLFPVQSPRLVFAGSDLPHVGSAIGTLNVWLLYTFDISTSVFPSGHVAVALSSTLGLWRALPEKPGLSYFLFAVSTMVYLATIYSRYHYAADGLASVVIAVIAWGLSSLMEQHA